MSNVPARLDPVHESPSLEELFSDAVPVIAGMDADAIAFMESHFGYDQPLSEEEMEEIARQHEADCERCDADVASAEIEALLAKYPGMADLSDDALIDIVAHPPRLMEDVDAVTAVAAELLARRARG